LFLFSSVYLCEEETEFVVRSASGDVDIPVILIGNYRPNTRVYLDNGTGRSRQILDLSTSELDDLQREAVTDRLSCLHR